MSDFVCNSCDAVQDTTDWIELGSHDGDEFEVECQNCEVMIEVMMAINVSYENLANRW